MEKYSNEGLSILIKGIEQQISRLEKKHDNGIFKLNECLYGNGKPGLIEEVRSIATWKKGIVAFLIVVILPMGFIVFKEWIKGII